MHAAITAQPFRALKPCGAVSSKDAFGGYPALYRPRFRHTPFPRGCRWRSDGARASSGCTSHPLPMRPRRGCRAASVGALRHCRRAVPRPSGADLAAADTARLRGEMRVHHLRSFWRGFWPLKHISPLLIIIPVSIKPSKRHSCHRCFSKNHRLPSLRENPRWE